jgi:hypothetical protein
MATVVAVVKVAVTRELELEHVERERQKQPLQQLRPDVREARNEESTILWTFNKFIFAK